MSSKGKPRKYVYPTRTVTIRKAQAFDLLRAGGFLPRTKAAEALRIARRFG